MPRSRNGGAVVAILLLVVTVLVHVSLSVQTGAAQEAASIPLRLASGAFDPLLQAPPVLTVEGEGGFAGASAGGRYYIVQFVGPVDEGDKAAVTGLGAQLLSYVPEYAFIVEMGGATRDAVSQLEQVRWVGAYRTEYRLSTEARALSSRAVAHVAAQETDMEAVALPVPAEAELDILVFPGADIDGIVKDAQELGAEVDSVSARERGSKLRLRVEPASIVALAGLEGVAWVELAPEWQLFNEVAQANGVIDVADVWTTHGYTGSSQIIAIADSQLDTGSSLTYVDDFRECSGSSPRVTVSQLGTATFDTSGHGTHVAGSVLGNGRMDGSSCGNYVGFAAGSAPEARGYFQAVLNTNGSLGGLPLNLNNLFQPAYDFGARIHTNSWGSSMMGAYTTSSMEADDFMWNHKDFLILYAAGNDGRDINADGVIDAGSLGAPGTAKNVLTVGASENPGQGGGSWNTWYTPVSPLNGDAYTDDVNGLSAFSSRGPTEDGRFKPDVVAPGIFVRSVRSTQIGGSGDYVLMAGTSMATPLTAGATVLAREAFLDTQTYAPSAAMLKALLANGATDMFPGQYGMGSGREIPTTRPTDQAGWGRVDLEDSLFASADRRVYWWDQSDSLMSSLNNLSTGQTVTYTFEITSSATPLAATMAWTDYPGTPVASGGLVNDLDVHLEGPGGATYYANNARQRDGSETLDPTGGLFDIYRPSLNNNTRLATLLKPLNYPAVPVSAKVWFYNNGASPAGAVTFDLVLYDNDGANGAPGTVLCTVNGNRIAWGSDTGLYPAVLDLSSCPIISAATGDFFLSAEFTGATSNSVGLLGQAVSTPSLYRSWQDTGGGWTQYTSANFGLSAVVYKPISPPTDYDRVNNLVGIDLDAPPTGVYTLTVSGHNVPQGPQPYALALSGSARLLGQETVTRTIDGPGLYRFGNTGVSIEFVSEEVDTVAVTVRRDTFPTTNLNDQVINREYEITTAGGTGDFEANVTLAYETAELNGQDEAQLDAYRYDGSNWVPVPADGRDVAGNTVTVNGVTAFSRWTLGAGSVPTALGLGAARATPVNGGVLLLFIVALSVVSGTILLGRRSMRQG